MPSRRTFVAGTLAVATGAVAGCAALSGSEPLHKVEMDNNTGEDVAVFVEVRDSDGEALFSNTFQMQAGNQDEGAEPFDGAPATIAIAVGDAEALTGPWPSLVTEFRAGEPPETRGESICMEGGQEPTGVFVRVNSAAHAVLEPTCGTFR